MEHQSLKSTAELRSKLREYGYRGYTTMNKEQLSNSVFVAEKEQEISKKFKPNPINFSKFSIGRCNAFRHQRFVSTNDMNIVKYVIFTSLKDDIDFKSSDVKEYIWVSVYKKKDIDDLFIHCLLQIYNGYFYYFDIRIEDGGKVDLKMAKDKNHTNIVNNIMTNEQYYWYRYTTELQRQIELVRDLHPRISPEISKKVNDIIYLYYKLNESEAKISSMKHLKINKIQDYENLNFDYLQKVKKIYWVHLNYTSNDKSYLIYQNLDGVYILIKFTYNMKVIEGIPQGDINMIKVYLSENYKDLIDKSLVNMEYEAYMNETTKF